MCICGRHTIEQNVVLYINVYIRTCSVQKEWRARVSDSTKSTVKQSRIVTIFLAALYELYDTNTHTHTDPFVQYAVAIYFQRK